jgi:hypothetical protein
MRLTDNACAKIGEENGVKIAKMKLLGQPNPDKRYCSAILLLSNQEEAEKVIN